MQSLYKKDTRNFPQKKTSNGLKEEEFTELYGFFIYVKIKINSTKIL
ncbi:hypothetical protein LEP1GSC172_3788 [Leptospira noguchii]|uniref:Uncharacterized protein n=2 Tax=Leptospira noguchii TaxID=28182 RepID=T0GXB3_9LEPT|nr:hypothetical protein LEP1GSC172_3788 [Leptospira noguchii]EQA73577.1 hypothetical protein LEP1GSC059_2518 [Leptospira noguchii serovar Panama str. CZ214]